MIWLTAIAALTANAYEVIEDDLGQPITWDRMPLQYEVNLDGAPTTLSAEDWQASIKSAFKRWSEVEGTRIDFDLIGKTDSPGASVADGQNMVWFDTVWDDDPNVGMRTNVWLTGSGMPVGFDIRVNATLDWSLDDSGPDAQAALTHEVGHVLGLDHSADESATMFYSLGPGEAFRRELSTDDEDGVLFLYSYVELEPPAILTCNSTGGAPSWLPLFLLPVLIRRRKDASRGAQ